MRLIRGASSVAGLLVVASACATSTGGALGAQGQIVPADQGSTQLATKATWDSLAAESVAEREGPRVSVRAEFGNVSGSRQLRADFHLDDDAYVVVGHLDADGVVRIVFPADPADDGFLHGQKNYKTNEFFAGFVDEYAYRVRTGQTHFTSASTDSYDGGLGYVFVIASWRPMHLERFNTDGKWDTYELTDLDYMNDPRPAIYDLASLLAGNNPEAYTVKFARYYNSQNLYADGFGDGSAYGLGYCAGYAPIGYASSPFNSIYGLSQFGENILYRGTPLYYNAAGDCYEPGYAFGFGYPYSYSFAAPQVVGRRRLSPFMVPRKPIPPLIQGHRFAQRDAVAADAAHGIVNTSTKYRARGLLTAADPTADTGHPVTGARLDNADDSHVRPSIEQMIRRRAEASNDASTPSREWPSARAGLDGGTMRRMPVSARSPNDANARGESPRAFEGAERESGRAAPPRRAEPSHSEPSRSEPSHPRPSSGAESSGRSSSPPPAAPASRPTASSSSRRPE
jgi:hypothetical protein